MKILVLNGPNLNLLGLREPELYGELSLAQIEESLRNQAVAASCEFEFMQSNYEVALVTKIQECLILDRVDFIIINPAALTHSSIALRDALLGVKVPFIEVHLSNIFARENFRQHSYLADVAVGVICGLGARGYTLALDYALSYLHAIVADSAGHGGALKNENLIK